ncbi:hypothetical protein EMPS_08378 [Entomortierella parvispora]|uniref:DUF2470 domain-containing protein n=1 Tax=Entomortierella parvispora TaxID=205924 RepID=A0A9P3HFW7_9FUNG|nr:hypothetical protein EMPS_08378 [Entomortierella parvispora]
MRRSQQSDPIAPHSQALCDYMNGRPAVVLSYARYFGEFTEAESATMDQIDKDGFIVKCMEGGQEHEVRVAFTHSLHAISQVKDMLTSLAKEAELALRGPDPKAQGNMPDSKFFWPAFDTPYLAIIVIVSTLLYLDFMPHTTSPALQWLLQLVGPDIVHLIIQVLAGVHVLEALVSIYLTVVVGQGFFEPTHVVQWGLAILVFGYPFLSALIPVAKRQQQAAARKQNQ